MTSVPYDENKVTYFAETDARNKKIKFGIKAKDRTRHVYVIGKTGMGKSTLLENMAVQDIQNGEGLAFIDPHGKTTDLLLEYVPEHRIKDVVYIAPFDVEYPISFNVLESVDRDKRHLVVSGLMSTFKKIWEDAWSARMEYILTNTLLALLECPGSTLLGVNRMLSDKEYRKEVVSHVQDPSVKTFWVKEFANYTERQAAEAVPAIQNKVGQFTANPLIRNMIGQPRSSFDIREAMDSRKILIINLSKGKIGDDNMKLLGGLLVTKIYLAAMSRADVPDRTLKILPNFYLFVDEFQNFANASFADILSEARKYKLNLTIAHQYVEQMDEHVRAAVFGNVGTMIAFRVGATDAEILEKEFAPTFELEDLVNLGFAQIYLKLMIDGLTSSPFSATTLGPIQHPDKTYVKEIMETSRAQFARPRSEVEIEIVKFHEADNNTPKNTTSKTANKTSTTANSAVTQAKPVQNTNPVSVQNTSSQNRVNSINKQNDVVPQANSRDTTQSSELDKKFTQDVSEITSTKRVETSKIPVPHFEEKSDNKDGFVDLKKLNEEMANNKTHVVENNKNHSQTNNTSVKPVSLNNLSQNKPKHDPKSRSEQNMKDLKNALADVLKRGNNDKKSDNVEAKKSFGESGVGGSNKEVDINNHNNKQNQSTTQTQPVDQNKNNRINDSKPAEVPEDVLKKVLDVK